MSGERIDPSLIVKDRQEEMRGFTERGVYHHGPRRVAEADPEGKFIGVRWVDVNKGTKEVPEVRSWLVGQEFAHGQRRDDLYAPTLPLAAARYVLSTCASRGQHGAGNYRILLMNIRKAFLCGKISRTVYVEFAFRKIRYLWEGTWWANLTKPCTTCQAELEKTMVDLGFRPVVSTPCLYYHPSWGNSCCGTCG